MDQDYVMDGLAHIGLFVSNAARSKEFYTKTLDFSVAFEIQNAEVDAVFVKKGNLMLELIEFLNQDMQRKDGVVDHIAIRVKNIEKVVDVLKKRGVTFETEEIVYAPDYWDNGSKWILFRGPDGEHLELNELL